MDRWLMEKRAIRVATEVISYLLIYFAYSTSSALRNLSVGLPLVPARQRSALFLDSRLSNRVLKEESNKKNNGSNRSRLSQRC